LVALIVLVVALVIGYVIKAADSGPDHDRTPTPSTSVRSLAAAVIAAPTAKSA
jgi:hypothetical protein